MKLSHISLAIFSAIALAACGGSSNDQTTHGGNGGNGGNGGKDETPAPASVAKDVKLSFTSPAITGISNADLAINGASDTTKVFQYDAGDVYIANPKLLGADGKSTSTVGDGNDVVDVYTKNKDGKYIQVVLDNAKKVYYAKGDTNKTPIKADNLYQKANATGIYLTGLDAFANKATFTSRSQAPAKFSLDKVESGESKGEVKYLYTAQATQKGADAVTAVTNADGDNVYINTTGEKSVASYKAYKQNLTAVGITYDKASALVNTGLQSENTIVFGDSTHTKVSTGALVAGSKTLSLPENVKASYAGKAFTAKSYGDLTLNVEFGKYGATRFDGEITRKDATNDTDLNKYVINSQTAEGNDFVLDVTDSTTKAAGTEYNKLHGSFYGSGAEEVAGTLVNTTGGNTHTAKGVFAAQKK